MGRGGEETVGLLSDEAGRGDAGATTSGSTPGSTFPLLDFTKPQRAAESHREGRELDTCPTMLPKSQAVVNRVLPDPTGLMSFDEALSAVGCGSTQRLMLLLCGLGNAADAVELLSIALVLPALSPTAPLRPDGLPQLRLSYAQLGLLSAALFWGALLGTFIWGALGDRRGRRFSLAASMLMAGAFALLSSTASSIGSLVLFRGLAGVGVGGSQPLCFAYLSEVVPTASRGRYLVACSCCWMVGSLAAASLGLICVPAHPFRGWRAFLALGSLPSLLCGILTFALAPESPRWLLAHGRDAEAMAVLRRMAVANGTEHALPENARLAPPPHSAAAAAGASAMSQQAEAVRALLRPPLGKTVAAMAAVWFGVSYGWYGVVAWLPELFAAQSAASSPPAAEQFSSNSTRFPTLDSAPFRDQLAVSAATLPGNVVSMWMVDAYGRRKALVASLVASAACAALFAAASGAAGLALAAACAFNSVSVGAWNALETFSAELIPTRVRTTGVGLLSASGRLGSVAVSFANAILLPISVSAPLLPAVGALLASAAVIVTRVPTETAGAALADDTEEEAAACEGGPAGGV